MKRLYKLTILYYIGPFIATFFIVLFVLLMQFLWKYVDELVGKGLEWYIIAELLFYASASLIPLALPLAILLSSIMTFGNLAENYELMAFKSAGVPLIKIMQPLIVFIILISIGAFFFSNNVIPKANLKFGSLLWDVRKQKPALDIKPGIFYNQIDNYSIRISNKNAETGEIEDILIYDHTGDQGNNIVIRAERGNMRTTDDEHWMILDLYQGTRYEEIKSPGADQKSFPHSRLHFNQYTMRFDLSAFQLSRTKESLFKDHYQMLNINLLEIKGDSISGILQKRQTKMRDYLKPYFHYLRDSAFFEQDMAVAGIDEDTKILHNFPVNEQHSLIQRGKNLARSVKGVLEVHAGQVLRWKELVARYKIEWHRKFTLSFACLLLFFIGAPLGAIIRKGGLGMPAVVSVILFIIFHVISITGEKFAKKLVLEPVYGMWLSVAILFPLGLLVTYLANKDSVILTKSAYTNLLSYLMLPLKKIKLLKHANSADQ